MTMTIKSTIVVVDIEDDIVQSSLKSKQKLLLRDKTLIIQLSAVLRVAALVSEGSLSGSCSKSEWSP